MIGSLDDLAKLRENARPRKVGATGGVWDILTAHHLRFLEVCRGKCELLIVLVNSDDSVRRLSKGPGRPFVPQEDRVLLLSGLRVVDAVGIFEEDSPAEALSIIQPDLWFKGVEYADPNSADYRRRPMPETAVIQSYGGRVLFVGPEKAAGSTGIVERILAAHEST